MPNLVYHPRKLGTVDFAENARKTLEIDRDGVLMQLDLRLQFTITNSATPAVDPQWNALASLFKRIEMIVGGRDTVVSIDGPGLVARAQKEFGTSIFGMDDTVVLTGSAVTAYDVIIPLSFFLPRGRRPDDTGLDLRRQQQVSLAITWGDIDDFYGTANAAVISAVTCSVEGNYLLYAPTDKAFFARNLDMVERDLPGSTDNFDITMDKGTGLFYRSFQVVTLADGLAVNTILDPGSISLEAGSFVFTKRDAIMWRAHNKHNFGQEAATTGLYYMPTYMFGEGSSMINSGVLQSDLKFIFDATKVTGTNTIRVYREAMRPLKT
jgi:hypothetical protein